jgi:hypothetical protein
MSDHPATEKLQKGEIDGTEPVNVGPEKKGTMKDKAGQVAHDTREVVGEKVQGMKEGAAHAAKVVGAAGQRASDAIMNEGDDKDKPLKDQPLKDKGHFEDPLHKDRGFLEPHDKDVVTHDAELREGAFIGAPKKDEFGHSDDAVGPDKKGFTDKLSEKAHNAADIATGAAVTAKEKGQQGLEVAKEKAEETSGLLAGARDTVVQKAHDLQEGVSHVLVAAKDKVVDVGSRVKETIIGPERKGSVKDPNAAHAASESVQQEAHEFREGDDKAHLTKAEHEEPTAGEFHASKIPSAPEHA